MVLRRTIDRRTKGRKLRGDTVCLTRALIDADVPARVSPVRHRIEIDEDEMGVPWAGEREACECESCPAGNWCSGEVHHWRAALVTRQLIEDQRAQPFVGQRHRYSTASGWAAQEEPA